MTDPREPSPTKIVDARVGKHELSFEAPIGDDIGERIERTALPYEFQELHIASQLLGSRATIVDVGGNIGNHAIYWAVVHSAEVLTFEPNEHARVLLARNVTRNQVQALVTVRDEALGAEEGRGGMVEVTGNLGATRLLDSDSGDVRVVPLDSFRIPQVDLIKIDVEGREPDVIRGAKDLIRATRPAIWVEVLSRQDKAQVCSMLNELGYPRRPLMLSPTNALFLPRATRALRIARSPLAMWFLVRRASGRAVRRLQRAGRRRGPGA